MQHEQRTMRYDVESPMPKRRSGRIVAAAVLIVASAVLIGSAATGGKPWMKVLDDRLPAIKQALAPLASSVAAWASSSLSLSPQPPEPSSHPVADAAPTVHRQTAPLSSAQLGAPLVHGTFVSACGAPDDMKVVVSVAVKMGHAASVTVTTHPPDPAVASCVERAIRDLQWDISPKTEHVTVTY